MSEKSSFGERTEQWFLGGDGDIKKTPLLLPEALVQWLDELGERGLFVQDSFGDRSLAPAAEEILRALNTVMAGGEVSVRVELPPDAEPKRELDRKLDAALAMMRRS